MTVTLRNKRHDGAGCAAQRRALPGERSEPYLVNTKQPHTDFLTGRFACVSSLLQWPGARVNPSSVRRAFLL